MADPAGFAAGLQMLAGFNAILQIVAAFLMLVGAYIALLTLTVAGIGILGLFVKAAHWLARPAGSRPVAKPVSAPHPLMNSRHA